MSVREIPASAAGPVVATLGELERLVDSLASALAEEATALGRRDAEALDGIVARKAEAVRRLETATRRLLEHVGLADTDPGAERIAARFDELGLGAEWRRVLGRLEDCRTANESNGLLIEIGRSIGQNLLEILRGDTAVGTYSAGGQLDQGLGRQAIAEV